MLAPQDAPSMPELSFACALFTAQPKDMDHLMYHVVTRRTLLSSLCLAASSSICLQLSGCAQLDSNLTPSQYLDQNSTNIELDQAIPWHAFTNVDETKVFLAGEYHGLVASVEARKAMINCLASNTDVRGILFEYGFGAGILIDQYLQTGDEDLLEMFMNQASGTFMGRVEERDFLQWLRAYNADLPSDKRLRAFGVDVDHQTYLALYALNQLVEQHGAVPDAIAGAISSISTELKGHTSTESPKDLLNSAAFSNLRSALDEQPQACSKFFGDDLSTVEMLCTSHERAVEYHAMSDSSQLETGLRDQWMAKAFAFVREANPTMNFFGQLGYAHTMQSPTKTQANTQVGDLDSCMPFATLLNEDSSLSGKICTIQYAYASGDQLADCTSNLDLSDFEPWCGQDTFFNLDSTGSPFMGEHCIVLDQASSTSSTTDYFQKLLLLSNVQETTPISS